MPKQDASAVPGLSALPLHAMLSAALVAFTIETDNEAESQLAARGVRAGPPSLVAWLNVLQYLVDGPCSIADLCRRTFTTTAQVGHAIGCLERWGWITVVLKPPGSPRSTKGDGWGSARKVTSGSVVTNTENGRMLLELRPQVIAAVEARWQKRHGAALTAAVKALSPIAARPGVQMPEGLPSGWMKGDWQQFPSGDLHEPVGGRFPVVVGRALLALTMLYEERGSIPFALAANTLRVVEEDGVPMSEVPLRSGISPETTGPQIQWLAKRRLLAVGNDPDRRGKLVRLTSKGRDAHVAHAGTVEEIEAALGGQGTSATSALRKLLAGRSNGDLAIREALTPPAGVRRSGTPLPALGRVRTNPAAKVRNRELLNQARAFLADPFDALPHYPVWDGNRGFGP